MAEKGFKRKLTAILSADVKGCSRLMIVDEEGTVKALNDCREIICKNQPLPYSLLSQALP